MNLLQAVHRGGRTGLDRFVVQIALDVAREIVGRFVAARAVLLQRLHHDPVQLVAQRVAQLDRIGPAMFGHGGGGLAHRADARAGSRRLLFADHAADFVEPRIFELLAVERRAAGEQLVEQHAQRIDVAARVDVQAAAFRLLGAHVERRADHLAVAGEHRLARSAPG